MGNIPVAFIANPMRPDTTKVAIRNLRIPVLIGAMCKITICVQAPIKPASSAAANGVCFSKYNGSDRNQSVFVIPIGSGSEGTAMYSCSTTSYSAVIKNVRIIV